MSEPPVLRPRSTTAMPCPACGVGVPMGYLRCPKCQAPMPAAARSKRATFREENLAGGTTAAPPDAASARGGWILAAILLAVGASLAIYFATRSKPRHEETPAVEPSASPSEDEPVEEDQAPTEVAQPKKAAVDDHAAAEKQAAAAAADQVRRVDEGLRSKRIWAKVRTEGDVLVVESALCDDPELMVTVTDAGEGLRASGFATVRCQEPNGKVDFESGI